MGNSSDDLEGASSSMSLSVGEYVLFGNYPQSDADTPEPIEWLVLDNDGETALLLSKYGLDCQQFDGDWLSVSWCNCELRKWMNRGFIYEAFNDEEISRLVESTIITCEYGTEGYKTDDYVFCLSIEEVEMFFCLYADRRCKPTPYAMQEGAKAYDGYCEYWLRSSGTFEDVSACYVSCNGHISRHGTLVYDWGIAVRPALRIKVK